MENNLEQEPEILAVIPARKGSRSIPDKNIRIVSGKPMLAHSIEHALASELITRTIVSTDSPTYAKIAQQYGAEVPFIRPRKFAQDSSTDLEVFMNVLQWLNTNETYVPDICVHLRPTYPIRKVDDIDKIIQILLDNTDLDSVRSVTPAPFTPMKMWFRSDDGFLSPAVKIDMPDAYNMPRQLLPKAFLQNACIDVIRTRVIMGMKSMTGRKIWGYVMDENFDIDEEIELQKAITYLEGKSGDFLNESKTFCFDIDGVISKITPNNQYDMAEPLTSNIKIVNKLYDNGHHIILFTARGSATGIDWRELTRHQMSNWSVKYHQLIFDKPAADYYIDDKLIPIDQLKALL